VDLKLLADGLSILVSNHSPYQEGGDAQYPVTHELDPGLRVPSSRHSVEVEVHPEGSSQGACHAKLVGVMAVTRVSVGLAEDVGDVREAGADVELSSPVHGRRAE
jgi:hypothetical protein